MHQTPLDLTIVVLGKKLNLRLFLTNIESFFDFIISVVYKQRKFSETFPQKTFRFNLRQKDGQVAFDLRLVLLPIEIDLILKKQG